MWHGVPPASEQRAIAAFLDRETAKIDALVSKKERLVELLREKRTALISHAVTKGLDPDTPMRASGVEWLGEIPKPIGRCKRLKSFANAQLSNRRQKIKGRSKVAVWLCNYVDVICTTNMESVGDIRSS